jgi:type II secretory pathway component GspD/PulD (secretin)
MFGCFAAKAVAQIDPSNRVIPRMEFYGADVRDVLRFLFKDSNLSYSVAPDVQGEVTIDVVDQTFETCLRNIVSQVDATYRTSGVYQIIKRELPTYPDPDSEPVRRSFGAPKRPTMTRRLKIRSADPQFLALLIGQATGNQAFDFAPEITSVQMGAFTGMQGGGFGGGRSGH